MFGDGPAFDPSADRGAPFYDGIKLKVGTVATEPADQINGVRIPPDDDLQRDLPRVDKLAEIGDGRNDENLVIAQFHLAFLRFHDAAVDLVKVNEPACDDDHKVFERARADPMALPVARRPRLPEDRDDGGQGRRDPAWRQRALRARRRGLHAARVLGRRLPRRPQHGPRVYDYNATSAARAATSRPARRSACSSRSPGNGRPAPIFSATNVLPFSSIIDWDRFIDKGSSFPDQFARRIDTRLAPPLRDLTKQGNDPDLVQAIREILKRLATRNLPRGYLLAVRRVRPSPRRSASRR